MFTGVKTWDDSRLDIYWRPAAGWGIRGLHGPRGDSAACRYGYGESVVLGTELHRATTGWGHATKSCCVKIASPRVLFTTLWP